MDERSGRVNAAVAEELRATIARVRPKVTNEQLAEVAGVHPRSMPRYLNGQRKIDVELLEAVARRLGTSAAAIMQAAEAQMRAANHAADVVNHQAGQ